MFVPPKEGRIACLSCAHQLGTADCTPLRMGKVGQSDTVYTDLKETESRDLGWFCTASEKDARIFNVPLFLNLAFSIISYNFVLRFVKTNHSGSVMNESCWDEDGSSIQLKRRKY